MIKDGKCYLKDRAGKEIEVTKEIYFDNFKRMFQKLRDEFASKGLKSI